MKIVKCDMENLSLPRGLAVNAVDLKHRAQSQRI
jgi:hypothetical protein